MRKRIRNLLLIAIGLLYVVSVPWYRTTGSEVELIFGLPDWVAVALGCYVAVAVLNAFAWLLTEMPDETPSHRGPEVDAVGARVESGVEAS